MFTLEQLKTLEGRIQNDLDIEEDYSGEGYEEFYNASLVKDLEKIHAILLASIDILETKDE